MCTNTDMLCMNTDMLCMNIGMLCMNTDMLCMNTDMLCMNIGMLCVNTDMLCMNIDMLCMNIGMLCMNIGMLCMNIGMLCMHVGIVSSINAIDMLEILCMLNLTQITPHNLLHSRDPNTYWNHGTNSTSAGLTITFLLGCSNIVFNITNITVRDNVAYFGGNIEILYLSNNITVSFYIIQCVLEDGFVTDSNGGGLRIYSEIGSPGAGDLPCGPNNTIHNHHFVTVINTTF